MEELQAEVEDLQAIKDLNDELEETHVETAQQMQSEIGLFQSLSFQLFFFGSDC